MYRGITVESKNILTIAQNSTEYSHIIRFDKCDGFAGMLITVSAGSVTVTQQCGFTDQGLFYDPVDESNIALGQVVTTMAVGTRWVQYDPIFAPFIKYKVVETNVASTTVTFTPVWVEDR